MIVIAVRERCRLETNWKLLGNRVNQPRKWELSVNFLETYWEPPWSPTFARDRRAVATSARRGGEMTFLSERAAVRSVISRLSATQRVRLEEAHIWRQPAQMRSPPATMTSGSTLMAKPRFFQYDPKTDRQIWLLELDTLPASLDWDDLHPHKFVCLCAMDASSISSDALSGFCSELVDRGCAYFCAWGPDCERLHDVMDQTRNWG